MSYFYDKNSILYNSIKEKIPLSFILYGTPGTGKTTIAIAYASSIHLPYISLNAVTSNKKDLEDAINLAKKNPPYILIIDEVHRINKDKQDILLPFIEDGTIYLIGATTANPYISINKAIRSRTHLLEVKKLSYDEIVLGLKNAISSPKGLNNSIKVDDEILTYIAKSSNGDFRFALNYLEIISLSFKNEEITLDKVKSIVKVSNIQLDKNEDDHYNAVSALQKSIRGSDVNASLYYFDKSATNFKYEKWDDLNGEGIAINESKAEDLGVNIGDTIKFSVNGTEYSKQIVEIFYTFTVSGLFVYTETLPELSNTRTNCWVTVKEGHNEDEVKEIILNSGIKEVNSALTKTENLARVDGYMANVETMTDTIKIFAIVLAVIVLINLSILNFRERLRDYATLKVLGYSRFEIARSMIYEGMLLTTVGSLLGMCIGLPLEMVVLDTNKTPLLSWQYIIYPKTYLIAFLLSFIVALVVNCLMTYGIKKISMSESLKSVE